MLVADSDPALLWRRLAAIALIRPLAWEPPYAVSVALEKKKIFFFCPQLKSGSSQGNLIFRIQLLTHLVIVMMLSCFILESLLPFD